MTDFDLDSIMVQEGYIPGVPAWGLTGDYDSDAELCGNITCGMCGHKGFDLRTFLDWSTLSYKAFGECLRCGTIKEL